MRIAYFGGDWFLNCLSAWEINGHEVSHVFCHGEAKYNQKIRDWALTNNKSLHTSKPTVTDLQLLQNEQVDCLFSIEYPWLIPCDSFNFKTINVHPSLLPLGRGPTPVSWTLMKYPHMAGVTFHKLAAEFDTGDIIYQERMKISELDNLDSYLAKLELEIPQMLNRMLGKFDLLYQKAKPQSAGTALPKISLNDRKITWTSSCKEIRHIVRASGQFGVVVLIADMAYLVKYVYCVEHEHQMKVGAIYAEDINKYCITVSDGICVIDKSNIIEAIELNILDKSSK